MENSFEKLEHYHDCGEHAINRELKDYKSMVFRDEDEFWLAEKPKDVQPDNPEKWSMRHFHTLEYFIPEEINDKLTVCKDQSIQFEWDWKEKKIFGGFENFFSNNSKILDLGSGRGRAVREINEKFQDRGIKCIGVDYRYLKEQPQDSENLVAGDFKNLPFKDNCFNGVLSVESFPCWLPDKEKTIDEYIKEITRVSRIGTIWRGTLPTYDMEDKIKISTNALIGRFVENGWEIVISNNSFIGKLVIKNNLS